MQGHRIKTQRTRAVIMITKIEVTKTYWIGMTTDQRNEIKNVLVRVLENFKTELNTDFITCGEEQEAIEALRLALLNT